MEEKRVERMNREWAAVQACRIDSKHLSTIQQFYTLNSIFYQNFKDNIPPLIINPLIANHQSIIHHLLLRLQQHQPTTMPNTRKLQRQLCTICHQNIRASEIELAFNQVKNQGNILANYKSDIQMQNQSLFTAEEDNAFFTEVKKLISAKEATNQLQIHEVESYIDEIARNIQNMEAFNQFNSTQPTQSNCQLQPIQIIQQLNHYLHSQFDQKIPPWITKILQMYIQTRNKQRQQRTATTAMQTEKYQLQETFKLKLKCTSLIQQINQLQTNNKQLRNQHDNHQSIINALQNLIQTHNTQQNNPKLQNLKHKSIKVQRQNNSISYSKFQIEKARQNQEEAKNNQITFNTKKIKNKRFAFGAIKLPNLTKMETNHDTRHNQQPSLIQQNKQVEIDLENMKNHAKPIIQHNEMCVGKNQSKYQDSKIIKEQKKNINSKRQQNIQIVKQVAKKMSEIVDKKMSFLQQENKISKRKQSLFITVKNEKEQNQIIKILQQRKKYKQNLKEKKTSKIKKLPFIKTNTIENSECLKMVDQYIQTEYFGNNKQKQNQFQPLKKEKTYVQKQNQKQIQIDKQQAQQKLRQNQIFLNNNVLKQQQQTLKKGDCFIKNSFYFENQKQKKRQTKNSFISLKDLIIFKNIKTALKYQQSFRKNYHKNNNIELNEGDMREGKILYQSMEIIKYRALNIYNSLCSFIRYPYQTIMNQFDIINITKNMSYQSFMSYYKRILWIHRNCQRKINQNLCIHLEYLNKKIKYQSQKALKINQYCFTI